MIVLQATTLKKMAGAILVMTLLTAVGAVGLALAIEASSVYEPDRGLGSVAFDLTVVVIFAIVGGVVALNRPHNLVGWAMLLSGSGMLAGGMSAVTPNTPCSQRPKPMRRWPSRQVRWAPGRGRSSWRESSS